MVSVSPSIGHNNFIYTEPFNLMPTSSPLFSTTPSYLHAFYESICEIRGYHPSFDPYYAYLEDMPKKVICSTFLDHAFDISMAFDKFKSH